MDFEAARRAFVAGQVRTNDVTDKRLQGALGDVPREEFVPRTSRGVAYAEADVEIAPGRFLLEARDFSKLVQAARVRPGDVVLDVGCGTGYSSAVLSRLAETVIGLEADSDLAKRATETLSAHGYDNAVVVEGPLEKGAAKHGPYDAILLNGSVPDLPESLFTQLAEGGRMALILGNAAWGRAHLVEKRGGKPSRLSLFDAAAPALPGFAKAPVFEF